MSVGKIQKRRVKSRPSKQNKLWAEKRRFPYSPSPWSLIFTNLNESSILTPSDVRIRSLCGRCDDAFCFVDIIMFQSHFFSVFIWRWKRKGCDCSDFYVWHHFLSSPSPHSASGVVWPVPEIMPRKLSDIGHQEPLRNKIWLEFGGQADCIPLAARVWFDLPAKTENGNRESTIRVLGQSLRTTKTRLR